jgi:hypothetical protein
MRHAGLVSASVARQRRGDTSTHDVEPCTRHGRVGRAEIEALVQRVDATPPDVLKLVRRINASR